jgi:signal transduction histidine kinase
MAFGGETKRVVRRKATEVYPIPPALLALLVILVSYLAARLGGAMMVSSLGPSVLWPPSALLVAAMLLMPRRNWLVLIPAGLAGAAIENLQLGFTLGATGLFFLADTIQYLIIGLGLGYFFDGVPRLNSAKALAKYCFFAVFLGPLVGAFIGASAASGSYAVNWRVWFFSEMLAFLTLTPAILTWASAGRVWISQVPFRAAVEAAALLGTLAILGYLVLLAPWNMLPSTLYSLVPLLLWAALRFGSLGVSTSMLVISFLSIWGAMHGHGPFTGPEPMRNVLSMQVFLIFAATPFMVLAAVVEEREQARLIERELTRRLISEQEKERSRIAGELHDDICQKLALLSMELQKASSNENHLATATKQRLEEIRRHCSEITSDVQLLSHELHSAKLDHLGISAAIRSFCREFGEHQEVSVEFTARDVPKAVSRDESLCLFRVTQEALHNAVKHSGADRFWVELSGAGNEVRLEVKDAGIGFDVKEANRIGGLGLVSMQERVRSVDGRFYIESKPGAGTKIIVCVPAVTSAEKAESDDAAKILGAA